MPIQPITTMNNKSMDFDENKSPGQGCSNLN
jgi:hypothetical protein